MRSDVICKISGFFASTIHIPDTGYVKETIVPQCDVDFDLVC
jgi:hypothetical protein